MTIHYRRILIGGLALLGILLLAGCSVFDVFFPKDEIPADVQIEQTVAAQQDVEILQSTIAALQTLTSIQPPTALPTVEAPPPVVQPTYTALPSYTALPTLTFQPTVTPPVYYYPTEVYQPTANSSIGHPYVLRVRNQNQKATLWIGTKMPYGGNFIKPLFYVEFYPPQPAWMHITWCRRSSYSADWYNQWWDDWYSNWQRNDIYNCQSQDVYVDEPFQEIGVR